MKHLPQSAALEEQVAAITDSIINDYANDRDIDRLDFYASVDKYAIVEIVKKLRRIIYPGFYRDNAYYIYNARNNVAALIEDVMYRLHKQISIVLKYSEVPAENIEQEAQRITLEFFGRIPEVRAYLDTDLQATLDGDPAAQNKDEIIFAYPGILAITTYRMAHVLYELKVPLIPRIMTEYAHNLTGIDIHPGATIGKYFFIDHGTGIVVGETTHIGEHVKVYQGVTLGALSTRAGQKLRGKRRHPTIEDNVTIYSGASILGGETVIGHDSVIGSNAFITFSVKPNSRISIKNQELDFGDGQPGVWYYNI